MLQRFACWLENRRVVRRRWQADARLLIFKDEPNAYYAAQRLAARSRFQGDRSEYWHWEKAASEVARLSVNAEMDLDVVLLIADDEAKRNMG